MIQPELKDKYDISGTYQGFYKEIEFLFSGQHPFDPALNAESLAWEEELEHFVILYAIGPQTTLITQVMEFRTKEGRDKYIKDGIIIFEEK